MATGSDVRRGADQDGGLDRRPFLESHRALPVRAREFERLTDGIARGLLAGQAVAAGEQDEQGEQDDPVVRKAPDRWVVQLGPVALTVAWLRGALNSVAEGELLVIVWRGVVASAGAYAPDRTAAYHTPPVRSATAVWEEVLCAAGTDEASWLWRPVGGDVGGYSSAELAERCLTHLRETYAGGHDDAVALSAGARAPHGRTA